MATVIFGSVAADVAAARAAPAAAVLAASDMPPGIASDNPAAIIAAQVPIEVVRFKFPPGMV